MGYYLKYYSVKKNKNCPCPGSDIKGPTTVIKSVKTRLPRLYRRGTHFNKLSSVPICREFALIPTLTDGEFPLVLGIDIKV